jgi:dihydrofolate reductase
LRKLILYIAASVDGYIAGPTGEIDWLFSDQDYGYTEFLNSVSSVLIGRKTYDAVLNMGIEDPFPSKEVYVFTSTPQKYPPKENCVFLNEDPVEIWEWLRQRDDEHTWLVGGASLIKPFVEENLIDEYIIAYHPIILGNGIPLFKESNNRLELITKDVKKFSSGLVQIFLEPANR